LNIKGVVPAKYIVANYSYLEIALTLLLSTAVAALVVYPMLIRYSRRLTLLVFKTILAESLYGLFLAIVVLLAYYGCWLERSARGLHGKHRFRDTLEKRCIPRSTLRDAGGCTNILRLHKTGIEHTWNPAFHNLFL
jgi:hypothetical protein